MEYHLRKVTIAQQYFQQLREFKDFDEKDGLAIGEELMIVKRSARKRLRKSSQKKRDVSL